MAAKKTTTKRKTAAKKAVAKKRAPAKKTAGKRLQVKIDKPLSKKNGWFYVSISMAAFFLTLLMGTFVNPQFGQYLQASILADTTGQEQAIEPTNEVLGFTIITLDAKQWNPITQEATEKLESILKSVFPQNTNIQKQSLEASRALVQKHNITTLPAVIASKSLKDHDLYESMKEFFIPSLGAFVLDTVRWNPTMQILLSPPQLTGIPQGNTKGAVTVYEFTDLNTASRRFYNNNWLQIKKRLLPSVNYQTVYLPDPSVQEQWDAVMALDCASQQSKYPALHESLYNAPQLSAILIVKKTEEAGVNLSDCDEAAINNRYRFTWPIAQDYGIEPHSLIISGPKYARLITGEVSFAQLNSYIEEQLK